MKEAVHMLDLLPPDQRKGFLRLFGQFVQQRQKPTLEWARLEPPPPETVVQAKDIPPCPKDQALRHELLDKMVILKLNGEVKDRGYPWCNSATTSGVATMGRCCSVFASRCVVCSTKINRSQAPSIFHNCCSTNTFPQRQPKQAR